MKKLYLTVTLIWLLTTYTIIILTQFTILNWLLVNKQITCVINLWCDVHVHVHMFLIIRVLFFPNNRPWNYSGRTFSRALNDALAMVFFPFIPLLLPCFIPAENLTCLFTSFRYDWAEPMEDLYLTGSKSEMFTWLLKISVQWGWICMEIGQFKLGNQVM